MRMSEVNKVVINNDLIMDLTGDTVTSNSLLSGITAHDAAGRAIIGLFEAFNHPDRLQNTNLNDLTTTGLYHISNVGISNSPYSSSARLSLFVLQYSENNVTQIAVPQVSTTCRLDMRKMVSGTWSAWTKIA